MMVRATAAMLLVLPIAAPVLAQPQPEPPQKPQRICRDEAVTGSRIARNQICMTQVEWDRTERETRDELDRLGRQNGVMVADGQRTDRSSLPPRCAATLT